MGNGTVTISQPLPKISPPQAVSARARLLDAPIMSTLLRLAPGNVVVNVVLKVLGAAMCRCPF